MDYYEVKAMSASAIKRGAVSMEDMLHYTNNPPKPTPAMRTGTLRHMAVLEPERFLKLKQHSCSSVRTKEYKALAEEYGADNLIKVDEHLEQCKAAGKVLSHSQLGNALDGEAEAEYYWEHESHPCKAKLDISGNGHITEFKTTADLSTFAATSARMYYHLQLGWYAHAYRQARGDLPDVTVVAQMANAPYSVMVLTVAQHQLEGWYQAALAIAERWWSGERGERYPERVAFELPSWAGHSGDIAAVIV